MEVPEHVRQTAKLLGLSVEELLALSTKRDLVHQLTAKPPWTNATEVSSSQLAAFWPSETEQSSVGMGTSGLLGLDAFLDTYNEPLGGLSSQILGSVDGPFGSDSIDNVEASSLESCIPYDLQPPEPASMTTADFGSHKDGFDQRDPQDTSLDNGIYLPPLIYETGENSLRIPGVRHSFSSSDENSYVVVKAASTGDSTPTSGSSDAAERTDTSSGTALHSESDYVHVSQGHVRAKAKSKLRKTMQFLVPGSASRGKKLPTKRGSEESSPDAADRATKRKRRPYEDEKERAATTLTRQLTACVRCRMQRNRCRHDPSNPTGPCLSCQGKTLRISRLPCLRYKITDSTLFRTGLEFPFYKAHPMVGPEYGDFHIEKQWAGASTKFLEITQDRSEVILALEVREFSPLQNTLDMDLKGRSMYAIPWAIADVEDAVKAVGEYADASIGSYLDAMLDDTDAIVWDVFHAAFRMSLFPVPNGLLHKVLKLWVVCRFIESRWRCCGTDTLDAEQMQDPFYDWISPPPYIDYQLASIVMHRVLAPLRNDILRDLQELMISTNKFGNWYIIFLTTFILMHNYELQMLFQKQFAARRGSQWRYLDMSLVRATHSGAKTILAHFHYACKGQQPFRSDFDWQSPQIRRMADLDLEQINFMQQLSRRIDRKADALQSVNRTDRYENQYWFVSQLFDPDWSPRDTCEYSPLA